MKFETKYNVGDKVWLRIDDIELYIKAHPYEELQTILNSCFREGYVNAIKVETVIRSNEYWVDYIISNKSRNKDDDLEDLALLQYDKVLYHHEENIFSNFDDVTNLIKETHKNVLNDLKCMAEKFLNKYE